MIGSTYSHSPDQLSSTSLEFSSSPSSSSSSYSSYLGFALTVNFIIGTGAFALPYGVVEAGTVLSLCCLVLFTIVSCICLSYVIESMARTGGLVNAEKSKIPFVNGFNHQSMNEASSLISAPYLSGHYIPTLNCDIKLDFAYMCWLYGGAQAHTLVQICMALYSYGVLWAYASVFSSSVDTLFFQYVFGEDCNIYESPTPACSLGYTIAVIVFGILVTMLSLQDMHEQAVRSRTPNKQLDIAAEFSYSFALTLLF